MSSQSIALVTGAEMAKPDPETHYLVAALHDLGIAPEVLPWPAAVDWGCFPLVVVRTPWDYFRRRDEFLAWAQRVAGLTRFENPVEVLEWNSHKGYLAGLERVGIPTVPTLWLDQGCADAAERVEACGWERVVVKPAISIGSIGALCASSAAPACQRHADDLVRNGDVLVQPYLPSIAEEGEVSLVFFGGRYSHALRKRPRPGDFRVQDLYGGTVAHCEPGPALQDLAVAALAVTPAPCTYARVDCVIHEGRPVIMELELIEPELFLGAAPGAPQRFAAALVERLGEIPLRGQDVAIRTE